MFIQSKNRNSGQLRKDLHLSRSSSYEKTGRMASKEEGERQKDENQKNAFTFLLTCLNYGNGQTGRLPGRIFPPGQGRRREEYGYAFLQSLAKAPGMVPEDQKARPCL